MKKLVKAQKGIMIKTKKISKIPKQQDGGVTATKGNTKYEYGRTPFPGPNQLFVNKTKTKGSGKTVATNATNELVMNKDPYKPMSSEFKTTINKTTTDNSGNSKTKEIKGTKRKFDRLYRKAQKATESEAQYGGVSKMKTGGTKKYQSGGSSMYTNTTKGEMPNYPPMKKGGAKSKTMMKTGGMVNSNVKVSADKTPGSKGVKSGTNPKASASKVAKGKVGGTSKAPKKAKP